ncbi:hypothetical protein L1049_025377 [Liquidambar formosana]|uniref:Uncharacterized protein n=1 Tax=Liquidambar formosana TaxID=63359 RepID=A0AAP0N5U9_LIQFO
MLSSLPAEIGAVSLLGTFDLHSNQLKEYPVEACKLRLSVLDLSNNSLSGLPSEIGKMTTLRKLLLTGNPLRTLRSSLVSGPTPALLRYLRSRLSADEESGATTSTKDDVVTMAARLAITSKVAGWSNLDPEADARHGDIFEVKGWSHEGDSSVIVGWALILSRNKIKEWPGAILNSLHNLSCLKLDNNPLRQALILSRNKIQEWPGAILNSLHNLSCLKLDNNPIRQFQMQQLIQLPSSSWRSSHKFSLYDLHERFATSLDNQSMF